MSPYTFRVVVWCLKQKKICGKRLKGFLPVDEVVFYQTMLLQCASILSHLKVCAGLHSTEEHLKTVEDVIVFGAKTF